MINPQWHSRPAADAPAPGGITELVLTHNAPEQTHLLLPMVAHLSQGNPDRWLTWVAPGPVSRQLLEGYGVDTRRVRLIHCQESQDCHWIIWEALAEGNSHTVIGAPGKLTRQEMKQLQTAAERGQCQGLMLQVRAD